MKRFCGRDSPNESRIRFQYTVKCFNFNTWYTRQIYKAWRLAKFEVVTSKIQLDEIRRASRYPKFQTVLQPAKVGVMVNNLQRAILLEHLNVDTEADDPNDAFLLAMSLTSNADYLVTGDRRAGLLQRGYIGRTRIVTPAIFCAEVL